MLVKGESGDGKSTLLGEFERIAETLPQVDVAIADFRGSPGLDSLIDSLARRLSLAMGAASLATSGIVHRKDVCDRARSPDRRTPEL